MEITSGVPEIRIGLIDGPIELDHPDLRGNPIYVIPEVENGSCTLTNSTACIHGTFAAGILSAKRTSDAPALCPGCTLLIRPIFTEATVANEQMPSAKTEDLVIALHDCFNAGANVINLSAALVQSSTREQYAIEEVLNEAARRRILVVAAAGNQGTVGSTSITRHQWVIPIAACDQNGKLLPMSNLGASIGKRGLLAPGSGVTSLANRSSSSLIGGTSVATPFVTGTIALLWSLFPTATASQVKLAVTHATVQRRKTVVPPLLNAVSAYNILLNSLSKN